VNLKDLWLGKNKIAEIKNLERSTSLKKLSLQSNRITKIQGLDTLTNLEELYLSHNGIDEMGNGLRNLVTRSLYPILVVSFLLLIHFFPPTGQLTNIGSGVQLPSTN
jgi:Leucine-rich repeat (LRR) protein